MGVTCKLIGLVVKLNETTYKEQVTVHTRHSTNINSLPPRREKNGRNIIEEQN